MRRALIAVMLAGAVALSTSTPAQARWGLRLGLGRLRHRRADWRGAVAASLRLLSGLQLLSGLIPSPALR
jgi:hypothetical protein